MSGPTDPSTPDAIPTAPEAEPAYAGEVFGPGLERARAYADLLIGDGVRRGLIGPREAARVWSRHVVNSALLGRVGDDVLPHGARVVDVGSGAGLPGIPLALARPDLSVTLLEPLQRRVEFLEEVVRALGIDVAVVRGRAEEPTAVAALTERWGGLAHVVTSRALAPLPRLLAWSVPLATPGGAVAAIKGRSAEDEIRRLKAGQRHGVRGLEVRTVATPAHPEAADERDTVTVVVARKDGR